MAKKKKKGDGSEESNKNDRSIARNKRAFHEYHVLESLECGIALQGTEVKSLRDGNVQFAQSHARVEDDGQLVLVGLHIAEYKQGNRMNHEPERKRKLLAHKREIRKLKQRTEEKGLTLVPLSLYWKNGLCKVELGVVRGKQLHDKRESLRDRDRDRRAQREAAERF